MPFQASFLFIGLTDPQGTPRCLQRNGSTEEIILQPQWGISLYSTGKTIFQGEE